MDAVSLRMLVTKVVGKRTFDRERDAPELKVQGRSAGLAVERQDVGLAQRLSDMISLEIASAAAADASLVHARQSETCKIFRTELESGIETWPDDRAVALGSSRAHVQTFSICRLSETRRAFGASPLTCIYALKG